MDYQTYKNEVSGFHYQGPELYHFWVAGISVADAKAKLAARGRSPGSKRQGRGISDLQLRIGLSKAVIMWCDRMHARRLTDTQKAFVDATRERAAKI